MSWIAENIALRSLRILYIFENIAHGKAYHILDESCRLCMRSTSVQNLQTW